MQFSFLLLATASVLPSNAFLLMARLLAYERLDAIVQPGAVSSHVHSHVGNNHFRQTFDPSIWADANCSTIQIQENKSNYWVPSIFGRNSNGTFSALPVSEVRIYYLTTHPAGTNLTAFPRGFRMVIGSSNATAPGDSNAFIGFTPQTGFTDIPAEVHSSTFPQIVAKDFLRAEMHFYDCWNGRDLDSANHKSHVAFQVDGACPSTHPVPIPQIQLEFGFRTRDYAYDQLVLSTGDLSGYSLHGDYLSFWDVETLQAALDDPTCQHRENVFGDGPQCETLVKLYNEAAMQSCVLESDIPQEAVGIASPIDKLPGCNSLWSATGPPKAACSLPPAEPNIGPATEYYNFNDEYNINLSPSTPIPIYVPPSTNN